MKVDLLRERMRLSINDWLPTLHNSPRIDRLRLCASSSDRPFCSPCRGNYHLACCDGEHGDYLEEQDRTWDDVTWAYCERHRALAALLLRLALQLASAGGVMVADRHSLGSCRYEGRIRSRLHHLSPRRRRCPRISFDCRGICLPAADAFKGIEFVDDRSLASKVFYLSFATLTTTGYGDIVPVHPWARSLCNIEAVIGQLYPATLLARLVTLELGEQIEHVHQQSP